MSSRRGHDDDRLAKLYDAEIVPIWTERFGRMLLRGLTVPPKAMVLDVGTRAGYPALDVLRRMDEAGRIISIDASSAMLDLARDKAGALGGKRIFFRREALEPRLSFADDVFDLVMSNVAVHEAAEPERAVAEFARVAKPGGRVVVTVPLAGTYGEFYDILGEVLLRRDRPDGLERLERHLATLPTADGARAWLERAGLVDVEVEHAAYRLLFRSSREFFFAPLVEYGPLAAWKAIAGEGEAMKEVFWHVKEAMDAYFGAGAFAVTIAAGCARGRKPTDEERAAAIAEGAVPEPVPEVLSDGPTNELPRETIELEPLESTRTEPRAIAGDDEKRDAPDDDLGEDLGDDLALLDLSRPIAPLRNRR